MFDRVESIVEVDGGHPTALLPFERSLSELVKFVQLVSRDVPGTESTLARRLVPVQRWLESVEE